MNNQISTYEKLRPTLFANEPLAVAAQRFGLGHDVAAATQRLQEITLNPHVETRTQLQAWHCLRSLGIVPDSDTGLEVHGMVVEVGMESGIDCVAAYRDRTSRYFNYSGAAVVCDAEVPELAPDLDRFLTVAEIVRTQTQPFEQDIPWPGQGQILINVLTPAGIHFGMGPMSAMSGDQMGAAVIPVSVALMKALSQISKAA